MLCNKFLLEWHSEMKTSDLLHQDLINPHCPTWSLRIYQTKAFPRTIPFTYLKKIYPRINIKCQIFRKPKYCPFKFSAVTQNKKAEKEERERESIRMMIPLYKMKSRKHQTGLNYCDNYLSENNNNSNRLLQSLET